MPRYNVHAYVTVRVKVCGVEADNPQKAAKKVEDQADFSDLIDREEINYELGPELWPVADIAHDESRIETFLVDEDGDYDYTKSVWLTRNTKGAIIVDPKMHPRRRPV